MRRRRVTTLGSRLLWTALLLAACQPAASPTSPPAHTATVTPTTEAVVTTTPTAVPTSPGPMSATAIPTVASPTSAPEDPDTDYAASRETMVATTIEGRRLKDPDVLRAMRAVPRHRFVPDDLQHLAYSDRALPIGYGQTISQPYIVAWMTDLLALTAGDKVLEVGTGSGYQAAVLAEIPEIEVYTIEIVPELADIAATRLADLGYNDVHCNQADGYFGWPEHAPFDAIIVTAAPDHLPQPLVEQLAPGGRLVIPIGPPGSFQTLWQFVKQEDGDMRAYNQGGVAFVPLTGEGTGLDGGGQSLPTP